MLYCGVPPDFAIAFQLACSKAASNTRPAINGVIAYSAVVNENPATTAVHATAR